MSNGCKSRKFLLREDALDERLSVRGQAVNRGIPIRTRQGENLAKLGGAIRGQSGYLTLKRVRMCTLFFPRLALISHILGGAPVAVLTAGLAETCSWVQLYLSQRKDDHSGGHRILGRVLQGHYKTLRSRIGDSRRTPLNRDGSKLRASSEGQYVSISQARILGAAAILDSKQCSPSAEATRQHT